RLHEAAGRLLRIEKVALQCGPLAVGKLVENLLLVVGLEAFEQICGVVAVELGYSPREHIVGQSRGKLVADLLVDLRQDLKVEIGAQCLDECQALLGIEQLNKV